MSSSASSAALATSLLVGKDQIPAAVHSAVISLHAKLGASRAELLDNKRAVSPAFKSYTADLIHDLNVYRRLLDEVEEQIQPLPAAERERVELLLLDSEGPAFNAWFDARLEELERLVRHHTAAEHDRHGRYFRTRVWDFIRSSAFLERTNLRPRGYAGDSVLMQWIYEEAHQGSSIFGKLLHMHPIRTAAAQAVRNRRGLIAPELRSASERARRDSCEGREGEGRGGQQLRVLSVACGPAWELRDLFQTPADAERYAVTFLDQDQRALDEARAGVGQAQQRLGADAEIDAVYLLDSVRSALKARRLADLWGEHDFIYSMGLFDYLPQPVARRLVQQLYTLLAPGGKLLIGNYHRSNPTQWYMEYWMDWRLIYRSEQELAELAEGLPGATATIGFEQTGSQMFLTIEKSGS